MGGGIPAASGPLLVVMVTAALESPVLGGSPGVLSWRPVRADHQAGQGGDVSGMGGVTIPWNTTWSCLPCAPPAFYSATTPPPDFDSALCKSWSQKSKRIRAIEPRSQQRTKHIPSSSVLCPRSAFTKDLLMEPVNGWLVRPPCFPQHEYSWQGGEKESEVQIQGMLVHSPKALESVEMPQRN